MKEDKIISRVLKTFSLILSFFSSISLAADEFPDKRLPVDENIWTSNEFVNAQRGRDIVIRRLPKDNSPCNTPDKCPPAIVIDVEKGNTNIKGKLNADAIYVGGEPIINQAGQWVGSTENLRGPTGPQGPQGVKGDSCKIEQDYIVCGDIKVALETLRGPKGDRGAQGVQGPQGARGPEGPEGPQGGIGPIGPQGLPGAKGNPGESCKIEAGFVNCGGFKISLEELKGPRGFQGEKGEHGEIGIQGPAGSPGAKGDRGEAGAPGPAGSQGAKGDKGEAGAQGPAGSPGAKGDTGATGLRGLSGERGPAGESCVKGASIYPACLEGLKSQGLFKIVSSEKIPDDIFQCIDEGGGLLAAAVGECPSSHPNVVTGSCETLWRETQESTIQAFTPVASMPVGKSGWRCEWSANSLMGCFKTRVRVWLTCTSMGATVN